MNKDQHAAKARARRASLRTQVIEKLGGVCQRCGFSDRRALQIDHVNGGGRQELLTTPHATYSRHVLNSLNAGEKKYQLLCANCNWIKRHENGEYK